MVDSLVVPFSVVVTDVLLYAGIKLDAVIHRIEINVVIFNRSPKSFYSDVVFTASFAIHADFHIMMLCAFFRPVHTGKLTSLFGVDYFRNTVPENGFSKHINAV